MNIRQKFILLMLLIGLVPSLVVSLVGYITISRELTNRTVSQLESIATKQAQRIQSLLQDRKEATIKLANQYALQVDLSDYSANRSRVGAVADLNSILYNAKLNNSNLQAVYLTDTKDTVIAATTEDTIGKAFVVQNDLISSQVIQDGVGIAVQEDARDGIDKLFITTHIKVNQVDVAVLTSVFWINELVKTVQDYTGLGTNGETVVAAGNKDKKYVSLLPLRFDADAGLKRDLSKFNLDASPNVTTHQDVVDYRGKHVVESVTNIAVANWSLATKLDRSEAFAPIQKLGDTLLVIVAVSSIAIIVISLYFTRFFTAPIIALTEKTRSITEGDYTQRITVTSRDEVGRLASSFNEMTESLQTSIRSLNEEHARLQASIKSLSIGFLMTSKDGQVASCNPAMLKILATSKSKTKLTAEGLTLAQIQKQIENYDLQSAIAGCLTEGKPFMAGEVSYGGRFLSMIGAPIRLDRGEIIGSVIVVEDITEAKILARSRDEFFSIASHELRTPLTAIKGNSRMIMDYYVELLKDPSVKEMLNDIYGSSVRLIDIVNDFLDVSRIEQDKITFKNEAFPIEKVIESVVYEMNPVLSEKKLSLTFNRMALGSLPPVWADANRTKQVVYNLVGNAAKFTEKGGIHVDASARNGVIKVLVEDTGRGIPLDKQQLLFRKFQQAGDSLLTRDTTRGTGLGLYISKMLVERMGGQIVLEKSAEGKGTTFSFTLPVASEELIKAAAAAPTLMTDTATGTTVTAPEVKADAVSAVAAVDTAKAATRVAIPADKPAEAPVAPAATETPKPEKAADPGVAPAVTAPATAKDAGAGAKPAAPAPAKSAVTKAAAVKVVAIKKPLKA